MKKLLFILLMLLFALRAEAATYYISTSGNDANSGTSLSSPWRTFAPANSGLQPGDTVYVRGGTYSTSNPSPSRSGNSSAWITYSNYNGETVTITGRTNALYVSGKSYIRMIGIGSSGLCHPLEIRGSSRITVEDSNHCPHAKQSGCGNNWVANRINDGSSYVIIRGNTFCKYGASGDNGCIMEIGNEASGSVGSYTLVENNHFYHSGHHIMGINGHHNVFRNNRVHNERWSYSDGTTISGGRNFYSQGVNAYRNLIEGNRFGFNRLAGDGNTPSGMGTVAGDENIVRRNYSFNNCAGGMSFTCSGGYDDCPDTNYIYHNTLYNNDQCSDGNSGQYAIIFQGGGPGSVTGNIVKNNIFEGHVDGNIGGSGYTASGNFLEGDGDPQFESPSGSDPFSTTYPDLRIRSASAAKDTAIALTTTTNSGTNSTTMTVSNAGYFMNGWGIIEGDIIQVMGTNYRSEIDSISGNTIYLVTPMSWGNGVGISLAYAGSGPDKGAFEYGYTPPGGGSDHCSNGIKDEDEADVDCGGVDCYACITPPPPPTPPNAPTNVATSIASGQITISWTGDINATSYNIYWGIATGVTKANGTKITNVTSPYVHSGLTTGCTYYYIVTAQNTAGESGASIQVSATAPVNITISWNAVTTYTNGQPLTPAGYKVYYGTTSGARTSSVNVGNVTTYTLGGMASGAIYYFQVTAFNSSSIESDYSGEITCLGATGSCTTPNTINYWSSAYYTGYDQSVHTSAQIDFGSISHIMHFSVLPVADASLDIATNSLSVANSSALVSAAHLAGKKALLTIGGYNTGTAFADSINTAAKRTTLINNIITMMQARGYDGVDIFWEPLVTGSASEYAGLITELKTRLDSISPRPLLTTTVNTQPATLATIAAKFDQINVATYDMATSASGQIWHGSALYDAGNTYASTSLLVPSANALISSYITAGVPSTKLGIGIPFAGKMWSGGDGTTTGGATTPLQSWTIVPTVSDVTYSTIISSYYQSAFYQWDATSYVPYLKIDQAGSANDRFISYDDAESIAQKCDYVRGRGLGGIMLFQLAQGWDVTKPTPDPLLQAVKLNCVESQSSIGRGSRAPRRPGGF